VDSQMTLSDPQSLQAFETCVNRHLDFVRVIKITPTAVIYKTSQEVSFVSLI